MSRLMEWDDDKPALATITIREQPDKLLTVTVGKRIAGMSLDTEEALALVEAELRRTEEAGH